MTKLLMAAGAMLLLASCAKDEDWQGWVYPDSANLQQSIRVGPFATFEACQQTAINVGRLIYAHESDLTALDPEREERTPDYECGYRCDAPNAYGSTVCEETRK